MLAFNPLKGGPVGGILVTGEREEEIGPFLAWLRKHLGRDPAFVTIDFDDAWEAAIKATFPGATIIICTFHATQLLTRGLLKEFNRLQRERNAAFIKECSAARRWSIQRDKGKASVPPVLLDVFCRRWSSFYARILKACTARGETKFVSASRALVRAMRAWDPGAHCLAHGIFLCSNYRPCLPRA